MKEFEVTDVAGDVVGGAGVMETENEPRKVYPSKSTTVPETAPLFHITLTFVLPEVPLVPFPICQTGELMETPLQV